MFDYENESYLVTIGREGGVCHEAPARGNQFLRFVDFEWRSTNSSEIPLLSQLCHRRTTCGAAINRALRERPTATFMLSNECADLPLQ